MEWSKVRLKRRTIVLANLALLACGLSSCVGQRSIVAQDLASIACPTAVTCIIVGSSPSEGIIEQTDNAGGSWSSMSAGSHALISVACSDRANCVAVGDDSVLSTTDDGSTWTQSSVSLPQVFEGGVVLSHQKAVFTSVSCARPDHCWAATSTNIIEATTDGGATWNRETWAIPGYNGSYAFSRYEAENDTLKVTCPTTQVCVGVGVETYLISPPPGATLPMTAVEHGLVITTDDGGQNWAAQVLSGDGTSFYAVSCSSATSCLALGPAAESYSISSDDGGATWAIAALPGYAGVTNGIACVDPRQCVAVGDSALSRYVQVTVDGGMSWQTQRASKSSFADLQSIACVSASSCWAVGSDAKGVVILHIAEGGEA